MFLGISHVVVPVRSLAHALRIYRDVLGFPLRAGGDGWADVDAASMLVRLVETTKNDRPASLRIQVTDVGAASQRLAEAGAACVYPVARTEQLTLEASHRDVDGNGLTLWRALSEDEYGFEPQLPVERGWDPDAEALLRSLLKSVPALFRALARWKVVREAERRAGPTGRVDRELAIRSFISAQARPNRQRLIEPLRAHGIDPAQYQDELDVD